MYRSLLALLLAGCAPTGGGGGGAEVIDLDDLGAQSATDSGEVQQVGDARPDDPADVPTDPADVAIDPADVPAEPEDASVPDAEEALPIGLEVGERAPDFTLPNQEGIPVTLSEQRSQPVLVVGASVW